MVGMTFAVVEDMSDCLESKKMLLRAECAVGDESGSQRNGKEDLETFPQTSSIHRSLAISAASLMTVT